MFLSESSRIYSHWVQQINARQEGSHDRAVQWQFHQGGPQPKGHSTPTGEGFGTGAPQHSDDDEGFQQGTENAKPSYLRLGRSLRRSMWLEGEGNLTNIKVDVVL